MKPIPAKIIYCLLLWCTANLCPPAKADTVVIIQNNFGRQQPYGFQFETSDPYNYQKLSESPKQISITFTQPVSPEESSIEVIDLYGAQVNNEPLAADGKTLYADLPPLAPGRYKVKWKARCRCTDQTQLNDVFRFVVR
jgi:methionine-rich copper-binding protein CopC